jgi:hypothetical protein
MCLKAIQCELGNVTENWYLLMCKFTMMYLICNLALYLRRLETDIFRWDSVLSPRMMEEPHTLPYRKKTVVVVCHSKTGTKPLSDTLVWFLWKESVKDLRNIELMCTDRKIK